MSSINSYKSYDTTENKNTNSIRYNHEHSKTKSIISSRLSLPAEFPSLTPDISKPNLTPIEFAKSVPIFRRTKFDLFGLLHDEKELQSPTKEIRHTSPNKSPLLTPVVIKPGSRIQLSRQSESRERFNIRENQAKKLLALRNERKAIEKASELNPLVRKSKVKHRESVGYNIEFNTDTDELMMDESERKRRLELAVLKKMDANEFGMIMLNEFCQTDLPRGDLVDASTGIPCEIPQSGYCVIQLSY